MQTKRTTALALAAVGVAMGAGLANFAAAQQGKTGAASAPTTKAMAAARAAANLPKDDKPLPKVVKTEAEWRKMLTPEQFEVTRQQGTERPYANAYWNNHDTGTYKCVDCGLTLFKTDTKFDSGTGWPSFWAPIDKTHVIEVVDRSLGFERTEVECARCGAHLGHVFDDGPKPTGLRYCMNSASLTFAKAK